MVDKALLASWPGKASLCCVVFLDIALKPKLIWQNPDKNTCLLFCISQVISEMFWNKYFG